MTHYIGHDVIWFRLWKHGPGIALKRTPKLFSERYGHRKSINVGFGWRAVYLCRIQ